MLRLRSLRVLALSAPLLGACHEGHGERERRPQLARAEAHAPCARTFDVLGYAIEIELLPETRSIEARCRVRLAPLDEPVSAVQLDLVGLAVHDVTTADGHALAFEHQDGALTIQLAEPLARDATTEVVVAYGGVPTRGLWFAGERLDGSGPTLVFSQGETEDNRGWFPCFDQPCERATSEITVTMPSSWISVGPGERVSARVADGRRTECWRMAFPHPSYLVSLVAGELAVVEAHAGDVPLWFVAEPQYEDWIEPTFAETGDVLAFLGDYTAIPYPYPKYSQAAVANFPWGGMENISATTLTPLVLSDERGRRDHPAYPLLAHEAAHQWFGDLFTCADWSHLWLNEGFATYMALLYEEATRGADEFRAQLHDVQEAYLSADVGDQRHPTVWNVWKEPDDVFDARAYQGAAVRLHLLRGLLGDEVFRAGVRAYAAESAGKGVVTADFQRAMERTSGRDLERFFAEWFLAPGFPEFHVRWKWDQAEHHTVLEVEQLQTSLDGTPAVFHLPVEVEVRDERGTTAFRLEIDERRERYELHGESAPLYVCFDHHGWIPKRVREEKQPAEWLALSRLDEDVNGRRTAVGFLGRLAGPARVARDPAAERYVDELLARLGGDASAWVRADAATALALAGGDDAEDGLRRAALGDSEARVRSAALRALRGFTPDAGLGSLAEDVFAAGASYDTMGAAAELFVAAQPARAFDWLAAGLELDSPHDVLAGQLLALLAAVKDPRVPAMLRRWAADPSLAPAARAAAVAGLGTAPAERGETCRFLVPFLAEESFVLRQSALQALAGFDDEGTRRALAAYYPLTRTSAERRTIETALERAKH